MKKIVLLLIFLSLSLYANIGKISAFSGDIKIDRNTQLLNATVGFILEQKDVVKSSDNSKAQIVFEDGTVISIGKNAVLNIAEFVNDTANPSNSKADLRVLEGAFKSITGGIGKVAPEKFKLQTKSASIGIRGTIIVGDQSKVACTQGEITVTAAGVTQILPAGKIVSIREDGTPSQPQDLKENDLADIEVANDENPNTPTANEEEMDSSLDNEEPDEPDNTTPQNNNPGAPLVDDVKNTVNNDNAKEPINSLSVLPSAYTLTGYILNYLYINNDSTKFFGTDSIAITPTNFDTSNRIEAALNSGHITNDNDFFLLYNPSSGTLNGTTSVCFSSSCDNISNIIIKTDNKGEFVTILRNYYTEEIYSNTITLGYYGKTPTISALQSNKIYTYAGFAEFELPVGQYGSGNLSFGEDFNQTIYLNSSNKSIFVDNQNYINNYDLMNPYDNDIAYGSEFNILKLNDNGTITGLYLESKLGGEGYHFGGYSEITGSLYGSTLQGLGFTSSGTNTHNFNSDGTYNQINSAYLYNTTSISNVNTTLEMTGYLSGFGGYYIEDEIMGYMGSNDAINSEFDFSIVKSTGVISTSTAPFTISSSVDALTGYFIDPDKFGALIDSYELTNSDTSYEYELDTGWFFSIPDSYNSTLNTLNYDLDDDTSWGYWTATLFKDGSNNQDIYHVNSMSTWIAGIETATSYIPTTGSANFSGHILGSVQENFGSGSTLSILMNSNNLITATVNFGSTNHNLTNGQLSFQDENSNIWKGEFSGTGNSSGFSNLSITEGTNSDITNIDGSLNAKFYGNGAIKTLGGNFTITGEDATYNETYTATGVFKAGVQ